MTRRAAIAWCAAAWLVGPARLASASTPIEQFIAAMAARDAEAMVSIVRDHRDAMTIIFFVTLGHAADRLANPSASTEDVARTRGLIHMGARMAESFDRAFASRNILYQRIADSPSRLSDDVRRKVYSDWSMALFLDTCVSRLRLASERRTIAVDLRSITEAAGKLAVDPMTEQARREPPRRTAERIDRLVETGAEAGLIAALEDPSLTRPLKIKVIGALGALRSSQAVEPLAELLADRAIRDEAVDALARIGDDRAVDALARHLATAGLEQQPVIEALGTIRSARAQGVLVAALGKPNVGERAAELLARLWGEAAPDRFTQIADDSSRPPAVRRQALRSYARWGGTEAIGRLDDWLTDAHLKTVAAELLACRDDPRAVAAMVAMLDDPAIAPIAVEGLCGVGESASGAVAGRLRHLTPAAGTRQAARVLDRLGYAPRTSDERARLAIARGKVIATLASGPAGVRVAFAALRVDDPPIRRTAMTVIAMVFGLPLVGVLVAGIWCRRQWLWPTVKVRLGAGESGQYRQALRKPAADGAVEPGTIRQTLWARSRWRRRQRIKVETLAAGTAWDALGDGPRAFSDTAPAGDDARERYDVLVSVGQSVRPGTYLARAANGAVRVRVTTGSS